MELVQRRRRDGRVGLRFLSRKWYVERMVLYMIVVDDHASLFNNWQSHL